MLGALAFTAAPANAAPISLVLPQGTAFGILGHDCGGIKEQAYATGFDPASGYPAGDVFMSTTCSTGGKGGHQHTYTAWASVIWDFTGTVISYQVLTAAPSTNPTLTAFDANGNEVDNQNQQAYLVLASGYVPQPRLTGISVTTGPSSGGTTINIIGTGFTATTGVDFGAVPAASYTINGDTSITAVSPAASGGTVDVTVSSPGGRSSTTAADQFTFVDRPTVTGVSPNSGSANGGDYITITGTNLSTTTGVSFGGTPAWGDTSSSRWGLSGQDRGLAARYADAYMWVGRPWLDFGAAPFDMSRALGLAASTRW